jgi:DNA-binding HxlR family transcriptional regulator
MARRKYDDGCATAHALDLVGERWALLIARGLLFGPKRFTDLRTSMPGASPNVLSHRLRELEEFGVVRRRKLPPPASVWVYELTEWGQELEPVITSLGRWGGRSPSLQRNGAVSADSLMLALKTLFDPSRAEGFTADLVLRTGADSFRLQLSAGRLWIQRGDLDRPHAVIETDPVALNALIWQRRSLSEVIEAGDLKLTGSREHVERFLSLLSLPEPAVVS